jgi:hypothetical protein
MAVNGLVDSSDVLSNLKVIDMSDLISELEPDEAPLTVFLMRLAKEAATSPKIEWMEHEDRSHWTQINNGAGYAAGATSIVVDDGTIFVAGDLAKIARTGEILRVTAVVTNTLTVTRAYGETAAAAILDDDYVLNLLNASAEGATAPESVTINETAVYNLTEIVRTTSKITKTLAATKLYGGMSGRERKHREIGVQHRKAIEYKVMFGERYEDTSGSEPRRTTRGLVKWLTQNNKDVSSTGVLTEYEFDKWTEDLFRYGSSKRILAAAPRVLTVISQWAKAKGSWDMQKDDETYGVSVFKYKTPHGMLNIVKHKLLENTYDGDGFAVDLNLMKYKPLNQNGENRDTKLLLNRQANDADFYLDEFLTEFGIECRLPKHHGRLIGVDG